MASGKVKRAVGLEIDTAMARVVEAGGGAAQPRVFNMTGIRLPDGAVEEGMIVRPEDVGSALSELWSAEGIRTKHVLLGISNQGVLVRYATVPKVPAEKLDNVIAFHAQEHLPIPLESVVLDYMVIGETEEEGVSMLEVLLVAARREMIDGFVEALSRARLEPADIDVSTLALMRIMPATARERTVAVVNVANGLGNILVSSLGRPRLARLVSTKLKGLADLLNCPLEQVINSSANPSEQVRQKLVTWMGSLAGEIRSSLNFYQGQAGSREVEAIMLNGRAALIRGVAARLERELGLPVRVVNPFAGFLNAGQRVQGPGLQAAEYAICAGLARRALEVN